ncbi:hypothetical protein ACFY19_38180 [Streptosporangium saharense]|uniref:hypothetical protein n=1 Tax=Streptosporangium saharense TaxID=1706840 RepID=UPI0036A5B78F
MGHAAITLTSVRRQGAGALLAALRGPTGRMGLGEAAEEGSGVGEGQPGGVNGETGGTGDGVEGVADRAAGRSSGIDGLPREGPLTRNVVASRPTSANAPPTRAEPRPRITSHRPSGARTSHEKPSRSMGGHHRRSRGYDSP